MNVEVERKVVDDDLFDSDIGEVAESEGDKKGEFEKLYVERDEIVETIETDNEESLGFDEEHLVEIDANNEYKRDNEKLIDNEEMAVHKCHHAIFALSRQSLPNLSC